MSELLIWDHLLVLGVFVVIPTHSTLTFQSLMHLVRARGEPLRLQIYQGMLRTWLIITSLLLALWFFAGRDFAELGLRGSVDHKFWIGLAISMVVLSIFILPLRSYATTSRSMEAVEKQVGVVVWLMPKSPREEYWFRWVSLNAGVCEEIVFRGFLLWYLQHFMGITLAAVVAALMFSLGHLYQGLKNQPALLFVSGVTVGLYLYTGSLWVPMIFHFLLDALQGHYIVIILRNVTHEAPEEPEVTAD